MKNSKFNQVGNFEKLVSFTNAQGPVYNPSKASIQVAALQTLLSQAQGAIQAADVSRTAYEAANNARQEVITTIPKMARRVVAVLRANGASAEVIADGLAIKRRFTSRAKKAVDITPAQASSPDGNANGVAPQRALSQLDIDSMIGNFHRLVIRATAEPFYQTNEVDLQPAALNALVTVMRERNTNALKAFRAMKEANQAANNILYNASGIYGHATATKAYIEAIYGFGSVKHKEVTSLRFRSK